MWWQTLLGVLSGLLLVYLVLLLQLWRYARRDPDTVTLRDALRLLPDVVRLIRRLAADRTVRSVAGCGWSWPMPGGGSSRTRSCQN